MIAVATSCFHCNGTGFRPVLDRRGVTRYTRCACRAAAVIASTWSPKKSCRAARAVSLVVDGKAAAIAPEDR